MAAGRLPAHRLRYAPGVPGADDRILLYGLCAEIVPEDFKERAWRSDVAYETGPIRRYEPRESMTRGQTCGQAWEGQLVERVKYCVVDHAGRFPQKGHPASLDAVGAHPGTACLTSADSGDVRVELRRCEAGDARRCRSLGSASYDAKRDGEAFAAWRQGCAHGDRMSCVLARREEDFPLLVLALGLGRDCAERQEEACARLEGLGRGHLSCQRGERQHANRLWERGCAAGHRESCYWLKARDFEYKGALQLKDGCDDGQ